MRHEGIKLVEGYMCLECDTIIEEVQVKVNYQVTFPIQDFVDAGDITIDEIKNALEDELMVMCPNCGAHLQ